MLFVPLRWLHLIINFLGFWIWSVRPRISKFKTKFVFYLFDNSMLLMSCSLFCPFLKNEKQKSLPFFYDEISLWIPFSNFETCVWFRISRIILNSWKFRALMESNQWIDEVKILCLSVLGVKMGSGEEHRLDAHKKLLIGLIISSSSLGVIILFCLGFWFCYRRKKSPNSIKNSGNFIIFE